MENENKKILVLMRHSYALNIGEGNVTDDFHRPLSQEGIEAARKALKQLKEKVKEVNKIAASPLTRAQQTARLAADEFGLAEIDTQNMLNGSMPSFEMRDDILDLAKDFNVTLVIGHNPSLSQIASSITGKYVSLHPADYIVISI